MQTSTLTFSTVKYSWFLEGTNAGIHQLQTCGQLILNILLSICCEGEKRMRDTERQRRGERKGKGSEGRRQSEEWDLSWLLPRSSPLTVRKTLHITTWFWAVGHFDYMLERTLTSLPWEMPDWKWSCWKSGSRLYLKCVCKYIWESVCKRWLRKTGSGLYTCRLTLIDKTNSGLGLAPLRHSVFLSVWPCMRVCASVCVCSHVLIHQVCGWVPIHYWAAGINSKCPLTHNFPSMSIKHQAEQALLVSAQ